MKIKKMWIDNATAIGIGAIFLTWFTAFIVTAIWGWSQIATVRTDFLFVLVSGVCLWFIFLFYLARWVLSRLEEIEYKYSRQGTIPPVGGTMDDLKQGKYR